jgi:hypothetical protein
VFAKRWAALAAVVILFGIVLAVVFHSSPPALYWQGEPLSNSQQVLSDAQHAMQLAADSDEAALSPQSRCYFSLPNASAHDVAGYLRCGPVLLPWSTPAAPWFTYGLTGSFTGSAEKLAVALETPSLTAGLAKGEVLRRPDGLAPPQGAGGLSVPVVPRQPESWGGVLDAPPEGLRPAPVTDLIGDWGQSYRLVASGDVERLSASLDEAALKVAVNPPGSAWATVAGKGAGRAGNGGNGSGSGTGSRPLATLLLPARGQVFVVAELAVSPGEDAGAVPTQASGAGAASPDTPQLEVVDGNAATTFADAGAWRSGNLTLVASVPVGSSPVLEVSDKGLDQHVSLTGSRLAPGPAVLSRAGTNDVLTASGTLPGVTVQVSDASLVWFAGSDGGTVPPSPDEAFLQILAGATPPDANVTASSFTLQLPGGQVVRGQALPDSDRQAIVVGFLVPASFSDGTVIVSAGGRSFSVPVSFP